MVERPKQKLIPHPECGGAHGICHCGGYWHLCRTPLGNELVHTDPECDDYRSLAPLEFLRWASSAALLARLRD